MTDFCLTILGSNSALPTPDRHPSSQHLTVGDLHLLIDCGEGTQFRLMERKLSPMKIDLILISHLHGDHVFGLPGMLTSLLLLKRTAPLTIIAPAGIKGLLDSIFHYTYINLTYTLEVIETDPEVACTVYDSERCTIETIPLQHSIPCNGYLIREKGPVWNIYKEKITEYDLSIIEIKQLKARQQVHRPDQIITPEEVLYIKRKPGSYAYCSDTIFVPNLAKQLDGISLLYHEATYADDLSAQAAERGHSTSVPVSYTHLTLPTKRIV